MQDAERRVTLRDGRQMPRIGFGCFQLESPYESVTTALGAGFRYIDTARVYKNEDSVGQAVRDAMSACPLVQLPAMSLTRLSSIRGIPRADIFVVSKVNARSHSLRETPKAIRQSLNRSGLDYIDLYLLHDAISGKERRLQAYRCLLEARDRGQIRSVGVSNWNVRHLQELEEAGLELPVVNQIELHPFCQQVSVPLQPEHSA